MSACVVLIIDVWDAARRAMLVLHPHGEFCQIAREQVWKTGTLIFVPDVPD